MTISEAERIAAAIRAALAHVRILDSDEQGDFVSGLNLGGLDSAEEAARYILERKDQ